MKRLIIFLVFFIGSIRLFSSVNLIISGGVVPVSMYRGSSYAVTINVKNEGTTSTTNNFYVNISINSVQAYNGNQIWLKDILVIGGINAGQTKSLNTSITIPCTYPIGTKYILAAADPTLVIAESDNNDNTLSFGVLVDTAADLVPLSFSTGANNLTAGNSFAVNFAVNNSGGSMVTSNFNVGFYLSESTILDADFAVYLGGQTINSLSACAQTILLNKTLTLPASTCSSIYYLFIWIDDGLTISESVNNNNFQQLSLTVNGIAPTIQATNLFFSNIGQTQLTVNWTNGNGTRRVVKINTTNSFTAPSNGTDPAANNYYDGTGQDVIYSGSGNSVTVDGLIGGNTYWFRIYEANCTGTSIMYNVAASTNNPRSQQTNSNCVVPSDQANNVYFTNVTDGQFTANWTRGNGSVCVVEMDDNSNFTTPSNNPTSNTLWNGSSEQVIYNGIGTSVTVTALDPNTTYWVKVYEVNCIATNPQYNSTENGTNPNDVSTNSNAGCTTSIAPTSISPLPATITAGQSITLSVTGGTLGTGATWNWYTAGCGTSWIGSGSSITVSPSATMTYRVRAEGGDCSTTTACAVGSLTVDAVAPSISNLKITNEITGHEGLEVSKTLYEDQYTATASPIKICADGSTSTKFKVTISTSSDVTFHIVDGAGNTLTDTEKYGSFGVSSISGNTVSAMYTHPTYMNNMTQYFEPCSMQVRVGGVPVGGIKFPINIHRAPLLFVHGLWGSGSSFDEMNDWFEDNVGGQDTFIRHSANYSCSELTPNPNSTSFASNDFVLPEEITETIQLARLGGFSAGKVDVVAHSMGGVLSRLYLQSDKYNDDIRTLTTINTPHSGTQAANLLLSPWGAATAALLNSQNDCVDCGAVYDLKYNSEEMNGNLNGNDVLVPSLIASSSGFKMISRDWLVWLVTYVSNPIFQLPPLSMFITGPQDLSNSVFATSDHDMIVPNESQNGGAALVLHYYGPIHTEAQKMDVIASDLNNSLGQPLESLYFVQTGFEKAELDMPLWYNLLPNTPIAPPNQDFGLSVQILEPLTNSIFEIGEPLTISVSSNQNNADLIGCIVYNDRTSVPYGITSTSSFTTEIELSEDFAGPISILAFTVNNGIMVMDSVSAFVGDISEITSITFSSDIYSKQAGTYEEMKLFGLTYDGESIPLESMSEVFFEITNQNVADLHGNHTLRLYEPGITEVIAHFNNMTDTLSVQVYAGKNYHYAAFSSSDIKVCSEGFLSFQENSGGSVLNRTWTFEGGTPNSSSDPNPSIFYSTPGNYDVTLVTYWEDKVDTIHVENHIHVVTLPSVDILSEPEIQLCPGDTSLLVATSSAGQLFVWSNNTINDSLSVWNDGFYNVKVIDDYGCMSNSGFVHVTHYPEPIMDIAVTYNNCPQVSAILALPGNLSSYSWSTGSTFPFIEIEEPGLYSVEVIDEYGCLYNTTQTIGAVGCRGCMDQSACNFDNNALIDIGTCQYPGCIDPAACNYDELKSCDDGSCTYPGCTYPQACNYDSTKGCDDGSCIYAKCSDIFACNYDENWLCANDVLCDYSCNTCPDPNAANYDPSSTAVNTSWCEYEFCEDLVYQGNGIDWLSWNSGLGREVESFGDMAATVSSDSIYVFQYLTNHYELTQTMPLPESITQAVNVEIEISEGNMAVRSIVLNSGFVVDLYARSGDSFVHNQTLEFSGGVNGFNSVKNIALVGSTLFVGEPNLWLNDGCEGVVHVFQEISGVWIPIQIISAPQGTWACGFGNELSSDGTTLSVGNYNGTIFVFTQLDGIWSFQSSFWLEDYSNGESIQLSLFNDWLAIGRENSNVGDGQVDLYKRKDNLFYLYVSLSIEPTELQSRFGCDIEMFDQRLIVGANQYLGFGASFIYSLESMNWVQKAQVLPQTPQPYFGFGNSVSITNGSFMVGSTGSYVLNSIGGASMYFCQPEISGCYDFSACNFGNLLGQPCLGLDACGVCGGNGVVPGCTDTLSISYDPMANCDDGSCQYSGCLDPIACNFNPQAIIDDGLCDFSCFGCIDIEASNYNPNATIEDGGCLYSENCNPEVIGLDQWCFMGLNGPGTETTTNSRQRLTAPDGSGYLLGDCNDSSLSNHHGTDGVSDVLVVKRDHLNGIIWSKKYGGSSSDSLQSVLLMPDGDIIICARSSSADGDVNNTFGIPLLWMFRIDSNGNLIWSTFLNTDSFDEARSMVVDYNGDILIVGGYNLTGSVLSKINENGELLWSKILSNEPTDEEIDIDLTLSNSYLVTLETQSVEGIGLGNHSNAREMSMVLVSPNGDILSSHCFGSVADDYPVMTLAIGNDKFVSISNTYGSDGDVPWNWSEGGNVFFIGYDLNWNVLFTNSVGEQGTDQAYCIEKSIDGGYYIGGKRLGTFGESLGSIVFKVDCYGGVDWTLNLNGALNSYIADVDDNMNGNLYLTQFASGFAEHHYALTKLWGVEFTDSNGSEISVPELCSGSTNNNFSVIPFLSCNPQDSTTVLATLSDENGDFGNGIQVGSGIAHNNIELTLPSGLIAEGDYLLRFDCPECLIDLPIIFPVSVQSGTIYYMDSDGDGYGNPEQSFVSCVPGVGFVLNNSDCNDSPDIGYGISPGSIEISANGIDDNCNGEIDELACLGDFNFDGFVTTIDLLLFIAYYGCFQNCPIGDLNMDDTVNISDLLVFITLYGNPCLE